MYPTCLETVAEYHKWFASDIIIIYFHCFLSFLFKRKYILTIITVSYVIIIQLLRSRYQTCKFLKWSKIIVRKRLLILFAGIKPLWLFAWSFCWLWIPSTLLQCLETKPNTDAPKENVSPENTEEDLTMNFGPFAFSMIRLSKIEMKAPGASHQIDFLMVQVVKS